MDGVAEEAAEFRRDDSPFKDLARYRRFGEYGPVYEVLGVEGESALVELLESGEKARVPLAGVLEDPLAP